MINYVLAVLAEREWKKQLEKRIESAKAKEVSK